MRSAHRQLPAVHEDFVPSSSLVARAEKLPASCAEEYSRRIERIYRHGVTQDRFVSLFLRQTSCERLPRGTTTACAINPQPAIARAAKLVGLDGHDIDAIRVPGVHGHGKAKI